MARLFSQLLPEVPPSRRSQGGSDRPPGNPWQALRRVFAVRAAEVALGQEKVQSGGARQKLVETHVGTGKGGRAPNPEQGSGLVRMTIACSRAQAGALGCLSENRVTGSWAITGHRCPGAGGGRRGRARSRVARPPSGAVRPCGKRPGQAGGSGGPTQEVPRHPHPVPRPCCVPRPPRPGPRHYHRGRCLCLHHGRRRSSPRRQLCELNPCRPDHSPGPPGEVWVGMGTGCLALLASQSSPVLGAQRMLPQRIAQCGARVRALRLVTVTEAAWMEEERGS